MMWAPQLAVAALLILAAVAAGRWWLRGRRTAASPVEVANSAATTTRPPVHDLPVEGTPYADPRLDQLQRLALASALGLPAVPAEGGDARTLARELQPILRAALQDRRYFPRRPTIIPQLLKAIRNDDTGKKELVGIVMQDPVLTGDVLRLANSPVYRRGAEPVDTLGRAIMMLGQDGLRSLVSASVLQPVFRPPPGPYQRYPASAWTLAQHGAMAAQRYARRTGRCDSFAAHLVVLLSSLGANVLFRIAMDQAEQQGGNPPPALALVALLHGEGDATALRIVHDWDLPDALTQALAEQQRRPTLDRISPLGLALYYGRVLALARQLRGHPQAPADQLRPLLLDKGLSARDTDFLLAVDQGSPGSGS